MTPLLQNIRVLDLTRVLAGPWCTQLLADLGAKVVKVERPGAGDETRNWGPPYVERDAGKVSAYFLCANRGKQAIAVDFTTQAGRKILQDLAAQADVVVENYKVGGLKKYGLDYESLRVRNPGLVYCSVTGFGQDGPYAERPGYDFIVQGMGGLMSITGPAEGEPGSGPYRTGVAVTDIATGLYACNGILAALLNRAQTGEGQHIDVALLDVQVATLINQALNYMATGRAPRRTGNTHPNITPYQTFDAGDGPFNVAVGNDGQFQRFCAALDQPGLAADPRFTTNAQRAINRKALEAVVDPIFASAPAAHWIAALDAAGVPAGPINDIAQVFADPQVIHRGLRIDLPHPTLGLAPGVACPLNFSNTPAQESAAPPLLGQHTDAVLSEQLGFSPGELAAMRARGEIG